MGKITIKHYLNTNLKPYVVDGDKYYKIYVLIRAENKNTKLKSCVSDDEFTESEYDEYTKDPNTKLFKYIGIESEVYTKIIERMGDDKKEFSIQTLTTYLQNYGQLLIAKLVEYLKWTKELDIARIEQKNSASLDSRYIIDNEYFSRDSSYKSYSTISYIIETLRRFTKTTPFAINDDLFIYHWISPEVQSDFRAFWLYEKSLENNKQDTYYYLSDPDQFTSFVYKILDAMISKETTENLLHIKTSLRTDYF